MGLTWGIFFAALSIAFSHHSLAQIAALVAIGFVISTIILWRAFFKPIEKSNALQVDALLTALQEAQNTLELKVEKQTEELKKANIQLQQEITQYQKNKNETSPHTESLTRLARYDNLTSLPNRIFFNEILNKTINHAKRQNSILAVLLIDFDSFNAINHTLDKQEHDKITKEISTRFSKVLRSEDILAKLEDDEFIVLLSDIVKPKFASAVAEKILQSCAEPIQIGDQQFTASVSIGICVYPNDGDSLENLLKNLDTALFKAKSSGGNIYQFYTHEMGIEAREYIQLGSDLRKAIEHHELVLYYQPKLHIKNGTIAGVEALLRWVHPELGIIYPSKLIPLAEETGQIMQIGEWALREACKMTKYWQEEGYEHITVAVNLSAKQFNHPDLTHTIANVLEETRLNPKYLELEITEAIMMDNVEMAAYKLDSLKACGVQIAIDHFGTGYTSISCLKQFPISVLKIDGSFIKGIPDKPNDLAITNAFIALAHNLGIEVIAEGVETAEQVQYLANQNCDMVQGYFLSHPVTAQKITLQFTKLRDEVLI